MELQLVPQSLLLVRFDEDELNRTYLPVRPLPACIPNADRSFL